MGDIGQGAALPPQVLSLLDMYRRHLKAHAATKLALYGVGENTRHILQHLDCDNVVALLDEVRVGASLCGKPIVRMEEAYALGARMVVIVARLANTGIIYRRIARFCQEHGVRVLDINWRGVLPPEETPFDDSLFAQVTLEEVKARIDAADVVSFDVFDTLVYRDVLYPHDIFALVEREVGGGFCRKRVAAEATLLAQGPPPSLERIYDALGGEFDPAVELDMERAHLFRKDSGFQAFSYARDRGKRLFLVSDMYVGVGFLHELLASLGYAVSRDNILISCEHGVAKHNGLFAILRQRAGGRVVHFGDNREADVVHALAAGVEDALCLPGALEMLEASSARALLAFDDRLEQRLFIGTFMAAFLQDSFLFARTHGKLEVRENTQLAAFVAPFAYWLFAWLVDMARAEKLQQVLLSARDGWIFTRMYPLFAARGARLPDMTYLYVSRAVSTLAGIVDVEDIRHTAQLAFNGTAAAMLRQRFRLEAAEIARQEDGEEDMAYILRHREAIFRQGAALRRRFREYLKGLGLETGCVGMFDLISSGTCQKALGNVVGTRLVGLYAGHVQCGMDYKPDTCIHSALGPINAFDAGLHIYRRYFFIESIFSSPEPTVVDFNDDGSPVFEEETRTPQQLAGMADLHEALLDYARISSVPLEDVHKVDAALVDAIYGILDERCCVFACSYLAGLQMYDSFCQRVFDMLGHTG